MMISEMHLLVAFLVDGITAMVKRRIAGAEGKEIPLDFYRRPVYFKCHGKERHES